MSRLVYVLNTYSATDSSHFAHVRGLLNELAAQGLDLRLIVEKGEVPDGLHSRVDGESLPARHSPLMRMLDLVRAVRRAQAEGYRTVFVRISAWSALACIVASLGSRGRVFYWQSGTTIEFDRSQPWSLRKLRWLAASRIPTLLVWRWCHRFVTGPEAMLDYYASQRGIRRDRLRLLYNDVDLGRFRVSDDDRTTARRQVREELGLTDDARLLLFVHRLSPVRRTLDYLPRCLEIARDHGALANTWLLVVGGGSDVPALLAQAQEAGLADQVLVLGEKPNHGLERYYAAADVFLQPTHAEGFPRVLLEAMAAGLPIVTTDAGGSGQILGPQQQAFVTDRDRADDFGHALATILTSDSWADLADENLKHVERFSTPVVAEMYREVLFDAE